MSTADFGARCALPAPAVLAFLVFLLATTGPARAATFYTSFADFLAAAPSAQTQDFRGFAAGDPVPDGTALGPLRLFFVTGTGLGGAVTDLHAATAPASTSLAAKQVDATTTVTKRLAPASTGLAAKQVDGPLAAEHFFYGAESLTVLAEVRAIGSSSTPTNS